MPGARSDKFSNLPFLVSKSYLLFCCSCDLVSCLHGGRILWCRGGLRWCCVVARIGDACRSCGTGWFFASGLTSARGPGTPTSAPTSAPTARPTAKVTYPVFSSAAPFLERSVLTSKFLNRSVCSNLLLFGGKLGRIWFGSLSGRRWR